MNTIEDPKGLRATAEKLASRPLFLVKVRDERGRLVHDYGLMSLEYALDLEQMIDVPSDWRVDVVPSDRLPHSHEHDMTGRH